MVVVVALVEYAVIIQILGIGPIATFQIYFVALSTVDPTVVVLVALWIVLPVVAFRIIGRTSRAQWVGIAVEFVEGLFSLFQRHCGIERCILEQQVVVEFAFVVAAVDPLIFLFGYHSVARGTAGEGLVFRIEQTIGDVVLVDLVAQINVQDALFPANPYLEEFRLRKIVDRRQCSNDSAPGFAEVWVRREFEGQNVCAPILGFELLLLIRPDLGALHPVEGVIPDEVSTVFCP